MSYGSGNDREEENLAMFIINIQHYLLQLKLHLVS